MVEDFSCMFKYTVTYLLVALSCFIAYLTTGIFAYPNILSAIPYVFFGIMAILPIAFIRGVLKDLKS